MHVIRRIRLLYKYFCGMGTQLSARFFPLLVHPVTKVALTADASGTLLQDDISGDTFSIKDGLPLLLPPAQAVSRDTLHYEAHYRQDAEVYDYFKPPEGSDEREETSRLHQYILQEIPAGAATILDAGCGGGWLATALLPQGKSVISMDISETNPRQALRNQPGDRHWGLVANALYLPLRPGAVDCIVAAEIIEHVPDPTAFVHALWTALAPGGRMIITTPYNEVIRHSLCIHCNRNTPHNAHLHSFTRRSIQAHVPVGATAGTIILNAKILSLLRLMRLLAPLPLSLYRLLDAAAIQVTGKRAYRLMLVLDKPGINKDIAVAKQ